MIVYMITNKINGKRYVGKTTKTFDQRYRNKWWLLTPSIDLIDEVIQFGKENFEVNECIDTAKSEKELTEKETYWIKKYQTRNQKFGYNLLNANCWWYSRTNCYDGFSGREQRELWLDEAVLLSRFTMDNLENDCCDDESCLLGLKKLVHFSNHPSWDGSWVKYNEIHSMVVAHALGLKGTPTSLHSLVTKDVREKIHADAILKDRDPKTKMILNEFIVLAKQKLHDISQENTKGATK
jgi:hypothetical protein